MTTQEAQRYPYTAAEILANPTVSYWLKEAILTAFKRDALDALRDAEILTQLLDERYRSFEQIARNAACDNRPTINVI